MKTWLYFYIKHTIKYGNLFLKEPGWALNHKSKYIILSHVLS